MSEELLERIRRLERANRRWRAAALALTVLLLLSIMWAGGVSTAALWQLRARRAEAMMERDRAMQAEREARQAAELERARAEQRAAP
jgi:hypothetical protein